MFTNAIKKMFEHCTQCTRTHVSTNLKKIFKYLVPALSVKRKSKPVITNNTCSNAPAVYDGSTCVQIFVMIETLVINVYGVKWINSLSTC